MTRPRGGDMRERTRGRRLARIQAALACPRCRCDLTYSESEARCAICGTRYPIRNDRIYFIDVPRRQDDFDRVKGWLKRVLGRTYYTVGIRLFAPTFPLNFARIVTRHIDPSSALVVDPEGNFTGARRSAGSRFASSRFCFPAHSSPMDYHRLTPDGHDVLFKCWEGVSRSNPTGPVTVALVHVVEILSTTLSFGVVGLKSILYLLLCGVMFPLKVLDVFFINRPAFMTSAASALSVVRKTSK